MRHTVNQPLSPNVTLCGSGEIGHYDRPIEGAVAYLRAGLLADPNVIDHLQHLAELHADVRASYDATSRDARGAAFYRAIERSALRDVFTLGEIEHLSRVIRRRQELGTWGLSVPVNPAGHGYGRQRTRARSMAADSLELAISDLVARLAPASAEPFGLACCHPATRRKARQRVRQLMRA
jgi:hypothetical protein